MNLSRLARINSGFHVCFAMSLQAYRWCIEAMKEITAGLPVKVVVDVLRQASKVRLFPLASSGLHVSGTLRGIF